MNKLWVRLTVFACGGIAAAGAAPPASEHYTLPWWTLGGGGTARSPSHTLVGTVAAAGGGVSASTGYRLASGFLAVPDTEGDGVKQPWDNCTRLSNADQRDTNGDGYGNRCDPDLNDSGVVSAADYLILRRRLSTADPDADLNGDGRVSTADYLILRAFLGQPPGPSALAP
jgi:hypothetical protein